MTFEELLYRKYTHTLTHLLITKEVRIWKKIWEKIKDLWEHVQKEVKQNE